MKRVARSARLAGISLGFVVLCSTVASGGAPAPAPTAAAGPHLPEHQIANLGDFKFENGMVVKDFKVSYVTHGTLNRNKDNGILVMHHSCGDHHNYDFGIGPGNVFDRRSTSSSPLTRWATRGSARM